MTFSPIIFEMHACFIDIGNKISHKTSGSDYHRVGRYVGLQRRRRGQFSTINRVYKGWAVKTNENGISFGVGI